MSVSLQGVNGYNDGQSGDAPVKENNGGDSEPHARGPEMQGLFVVCKRLSRTRVLRGAADLER